MLGILYILTLNSACLSHMLISIFRAGGGLKKFAEEIAGMTLDKSDLLRRGDWEVETLSNAMVSLIVIDGLFP